MLFNSMGAPDFFSHKSEREQKLDKGEVVEDSDDDDDVDLDLTDTDDETLDSILSKTRTPFSSRTKNQFTPNAEFLRDPLKGRHATGSANDFPSALADVKIEASGMLKLHETFDVADLYTQLHRAKRSETMLNILSCQFSPRKDYLAIALSTGEIEVLEYDSDRGDLRICYTLMDRDVNGESINCTNISWLPDGKKLLSTYTNGFLKMWHVVSKKAVLTRNENEVTQPITVINNPDIVSEVFKASSSKKDNETSAKREVLCVSYSRTTTVNMEEHISQSTSPHHKRQRLGTSSETPDGSTPKKPACDQHQCQVTLIATGGSDGVIIVWILTDSSFLSKDNSLSGPGNGKGGGGSQLVFHRCCVHGGRKKSMDGHMMKVFAIRFLPRDPKRFVSGGWDGLIFKWDAISGQCLMSCKSPVMCSNESMDLDTCVERPLVLCGDHGAGFLDVIDYRFDDDFVVDTRILLPTDRFVMPYVCSFLGADKIIVGGSNPNCIRIIDRKVNVDKQQGQTTSGVQINKQGEALILGSLDNLPAAVSCMTLGKEDRLKRQQIVACCGSLIIILTTNLRH